MEQETLLTVAIPTYNRAETLEKIILQLKAEQGVPFRILISDDQSSDATEAMVRKYQADMSNLFYNKNDVNLGYSGNVFRLYELADTPYIWFLCDDETVLPGAIRSITEAMNKYRPAVAVFNYSWDDPYGRKNFAVNNEDRVYEDRETLDDYQPLLRITFLSILVVEKQSFPINIPKEVYRDNVFFQLTLSLLLLSRRFKFCEIGTPIVHRNVGYKYGDFFKFNLVDVLKSVHVVLHSFDNKKFIVRMKRELPTALRLYLSQKLGLFRYVQEPTKETLQKIGEYYGNDKYFIYSFRFIKMLAPAWLLRSVYLVQLCKIHGIKEGIAVYRRNIDRAYTDERKTGFTEYK